MYFYGNLKFTHMALSGFTKACASHTPGIARLVLLAAQDLASVTIASNKVTALSVGTSGDAKDYTVDRYGIKAMFEGASDDSGLEYYTHSIEAHISKLTATLRNSLENIAVEAACGIIAVLTDKNGSSWVYGLTAPDDAFSTSDQQIGMNVQSMVFDSGMKLDEEGTDKVTLTLSGMFAEMPLPVDSTSTFVASGTIGSGTDVITAA